MVQLYNTLTRQKESFTTLIPNEVSFYSCGLTVYSQPHIGNWVGYIYWDVLVRMLQASGYKVTRTQNYTDVGHLVSDDDSGEDKMEKGARAEGITAWDVAEKYIAIAEHEGYELLGLQRPTYVIRATEYIQEQISFVQQLQEKGYTYTIAGEGVYFDTSKLVDYGKLAHLDIQGLEAGARVSVDGKKNITDFALWKFSPTSAKRDMEWDSPWGIGFPGWHLECSVIARETLGDTIDLHAGGVDHIPVHHTNEIAQTESVTGKPFSAFWVHNNHLKVDGGKMSKSLGNIYTLSDILQKNISLDAFKLMIYSKQYRTEGNFTWDILQASQNRLNGLLEAAALQWQPVATSTNHSEIYTTTAQNILKHLQDDLDTPSALVELNALSDHVKTHGVSAGDQQLYTDTLQNIDDLLGLHLAKTPDISARQKELLQKRIDARAAKDWALSDQIRDELKAQNIVVQDASYGQVWAYAS